MPACTQCAQDVPDGATFCPHCGTKFAPAPEPAAAHKSVAPPASVSAADPFSHTMPADAEELARVRDMIAAQQSSPPLPPPAPVPVRERTFGKTKALEAVEERRTEPPDDRERGDSVVRERTLASPAVAPPRVPPPPPMSPAPANVAPLRAPPPPPPISPKAATTAQPAVHVVGAAVNVIWTDGNAYAATIVQVTPTHCSVRFGNGALQWVERKNILPA